MAHFFKSAESVVDSNGIIAGRVILSLVSGQAERWSVFEQSRRSGLVVTERSRFQEELFVGYECKRNKTGQTFKNLNTKKWFGEMQSELLRFERVGEGDELSAELEKLKLNLGNTELAAHGSAQVVEEKSEKVISGMSKTLEVQIRKNRVKRPNVVGNFQCPHCEKKLTSTRSYTQHIHMVHELGLFNDKGEFICNQCAKKFSRQSDLEQHFISKHEKIDTDSLVSGNRPEIGGKILDFDNVESLGDDYEYYPCPDCGQSVIKQDWGMELHLETLKPAVGLGMTCPLCVKDYEEDKEGSIVKKMKTFCERRALFQHYKFCRVKHDKANITN
ncbi:hypothetical protein HK098_003676 [Nowakowskiella sp. JEL0407]|nr:hypothetical protein HK098_003676 [Nowakowskiella sp. JEL0407]